MPVHDAEMSALKKITSTNRDRCHRNGTKRQFDNFLKLRCNIHKTELTINAINLDALKHNKIGANKIEKNHD